MTELIIDVDITGGRYVFLKVKILVTEFKPTKVINIPDLIFLDISNDRDYLDD